jgi:hypothetical protein
MFLRKYVKRMAQHAALFRKIEAGRQWENMPLKGLRLQSPYKNSVSLLRISSSNGPRRELRWVKRAFWIFRTWPKKEKK